MVRKMSAVFASSASVRATIASDTPSRASECAHAGLQHVVLAHLSQKCNRPTIAKAMMAGALRKTAFRGSVTAAHQDRVVGPFTAGMHTQLSLAL